MSSSSNFGGFSLVLQTLRVQTFDVNRLMNAALALDETLCDGQAASETISGNLEQFCDFLEQSNDPCKLVTLAAAARELELNNRELAEAIEDAILEVCLEISSPLKDNDLDTKKNVFETLLEMFRRLKLDKRIAKFTQDLEIAVVRASIPLHSSFLHAATTRSRFKTVNINRFAFYHHRPVVEREIMKKLKGTADSPHSGVLAIIGGPGIGKTTIMSHLLTENKASQEFLLNGCHLDATIWLNCSQWRDEFDENDAITFSEKLIHLWRTVEPKLPSDIADLADVVLHLETQSQRCHPLFVFDDMFNVKLLEFFRETCPGAVCCVITRDIYKIFLNDTSAVAVPLLGCVVSVPEFGEGEVKAVLETTFGLAGNLNDQEVEHLVERCYGLPLIAGLIGPRFRFCSTPSSYRDEYARLTNELKSTEGTTLSNCQCKIVEQLFQNSIERALDDDRLKTMYYAFLLFDPAEAVLADDLAIFWGLQGCEEALDICSRFERASLVKRIVIAREDTLQTPGFLVHQTIHEAAFRHARSKLNVGSLYELRLKIITGLCCSSSQSQCAKINQISDFFRVITRQLQQNDDKTKILYRIVESHNRLLLERIIQNLDAQRLLEICRLSIPNKGNNVTFLQFLFGWQWNSYKDYRSREVRHSFRLANLILHKLRRSGDIDSKTIGDVLSQKTSFGSCFIDQFLNASPRKSEDSGEYRHLRTMLSPWVKHGESKESLCDPESSTPLIVTAVKLGHIENVRHLCEQDPQAVEIASLEYRRTPLSYAAERGFLDIATFLVHVYPKAVEMACKEYGRTPLSFAAERGHLDIVAFLFERFPKAVEMPCKKYGRIPISYAAERGHLEMVKFLYELCPTVAEIPTHFGRTPLSYAAEEGHFEIVKFLYEKFPKATEIPSQFGRTPLSYASERGYFLIVKFLFERCPRVAEIACKEKDRTPALYALLNSHFEIVKFLFANYPMTAEMPCKDGRTPLSHAAERGKLDIVKFLFEKYPKAVEMADKYGRTPLLYAAEWGHLDVVTFLIEKYALAVGLLCRDGRTALSYAAERGHLEIAMVLFEIYPNAAGMPCKDGRTPLSYASERGHLEMVKFLFAKCPKAAKMPCTFYSRTPLSYAAERGHLEITRFLYEKFPTAGKMADKSGHTPLAYATERGHVEIVKFLYLNQPGIEIPASPTRNSIANAAKSF